MPLVGNGLMLTHTFFPAAPIDRERRNVSFERQHVCELSIVITDVEPFVFLFVQQDHPGKFVVASGPDGEAQRRAYCPAVVCYVLNLFGDEVIVGARGFGNAAQQCYRQTQDTLFL